MLTKTTYDAASALIRMRMATSLFLYVKDDELSSRSLVLLEEFAPRLVARGYTVLGVEVCPLSSVVKETSCVRVPQLRLFKNGHLLHKEEGLLTRHILSELLLK